MTVLRHAWAVFAALMLPAFVLCVAWFLAIRAGARVGTAYHLGAATPFAALLAVAAAAAAAAVLAAVARLVVQRDVDAGTSSRLDLLLRPALAGLVAGALLAAALSLDGRRAQDAATGFGLGFGITLAAYVLAALVLRAVSRLTRRPVRALGVGLLAVVAVVAVAFVVAERRGRARLDALRSEALREIDAERARQHSARRPVLREPAMDANAADTYVALIEAQRPHSTGSLDLGKALARPDEPLSPAVRDALAARRQDVERLAQATRSTWCAWPLRYEKGFDAELPYLLGARILAQAALLEGRERARSGDAAGAAERYLQVLRFGSDFGNGPLILGLMGATIERMALDELARLVRSGQAAGALEALDGDLARLEPALVDLATAFRLERLTVAVHGPIDDRRNFAAALGMLDGAGAAALARILPLNALFAEAATDYGRTMREMEAAAGDASRWRDIEENFLARHYFASTNMIYRLMVPSAARTWISAEEPRVLARGVRAAVELERRRAAEGRYPAQPADLPLDTLAAPGERMRYRASGDGSSYVLYSVGRDHDDDGGAPAQDLVLPGARP